MSSVLADVLLCRWYHDRPPRKRTQPMLPEEEPKHVCKGLGDHQTRGRNEPQCQTQLCPTDLGRTSQRSAAYWVEVRPKHNRKSLDRQNCHPRSFPEGTQNPLRHEID
eukprot:scaffold682464_cov42-Prasinocladus_malaysianus.AAC.1